LQIVSCEAGDFQLCDKKPSVAESCRLRTGPPAGCCAASKDIPVRSNPSPSPRYAAPADSCSTVTPEPAWLGPVNFIAFGPGSYRSPGYARATAMRGATGPQRRLRQPLRLCLCRRIAPSPHQHESLPPASRRHKRLQRLARCLRGVRARFSAPGIGQGIGALTSFNVSALCIALMPGRRRIVVIANSA
jgi:hypothetical protein